MSKARIGRSSGTSAYNKSYLANRIKMRSKSVDESLKVDGNSDNKSLFQLSEKETTGNESRYSLSKGINHDYKVVGNSNRFSKDKLIFNEADGDSGGEMGKTRYQFFGHITKSPTADIHSAQKSSRIPIAPGKETLSGKSLHSGINRATSSYPVRSQGRFDRHDTVDQSERSNVGNPLTLPRSTHTRSYVANKLKDLKLQRSRSCENLQEGNPISSDGSFPVCHRFPNCSVCTISIPHSQVNKETVVRAMQDELKEESENMAIMEQKDKEIHLKSESISQITQLLQKTKKELEHKTSECNRREAEIKQLKDELKSISDEKKDLEHSLSEQQLKIIKLESVETRLSQMAEKYDTLFAENRELVERVRNLEITEKEFIDLERNVIELQTQLHDMEDIELHRDELLVKLQDVKKQRDEFLEKGKMVEEERNEFVRSNKTLEQYIFEWKRKTTEFKKTNQSLKDKILSLEKDKKELEIRVSDIQAERTSMQTQMSKIECERDDCLRDLREMKLDRNAIEAKLSDLEEAMYDYDQLEEGFHSLRLKLAELTRQRDDMELLIPSYKAKIKVLKKTIREREESIIQLSHEVKTMKVIMENFTYDDLSQFQSMGGSDSSATKHASSHTKKYRPSDLNMTSESEPYDLVMSRPAQNEYYSDDSITFDKSERKKATNSNRRSKVDWM